MNEGTSKKDFITIITGSAQGFGKEFAKRLLQSGARVCISDVNQSEGQKTTDEFIQVFGKDKVTFKECNVTKQEDWDGLWNHAEDCFGDQVTLLINNAGVGPQFGWKACVDIMLVGVSIGVFCVRSSLINWYKNEILKNYP